MKRNLTGIVGLATLLVCVLPVRGQERNHVKISVSSPAEIRIEAKLQSPAKSWSFRNAYAGVLGIAERIDEFRARVSDGSDAGARKVATGEFRSNLNATNISYAVRLPAPSPSSVSHVSWIAGNSGFLMLADLIPENLRSVSVDFSLPSGWVAHSTVSPDSQGEYFVTEPERAVFFAGRSLRKDGKVVEGIALECVVGGVWPFKDSAALKAATRVLRKYLVLTGFKLPDRATIMIAPLPVSVGSVKWRAEARGSTVVLLMDPNAKSENWEGQLGVIFTHELLHLWVPNSLRLQGDYDWFFEGFTLYTALVTGLELKLISFREFLDTLARVYDSYRSDADGLSLIDASERRWTGAGSLVYDKGMLVAFLYDLSVREESGGKTRLADRYRALFSRRGGEPANGNEAIIQVLSVSPAAADFTKRYIEGGSEFELERILSSFGLLLDSTGNSSRLTVAPQLDAEQKRLLRSLGYRR